MMAGCVINTIGVANGIVDQMVAVLLLVHECNFMITGACSLTHTAR